MAPIKTNNPYASYFDFFSRTGTDAAGPNVAPAFGAPQGLTATGGVISDYTTGPGAVYRAHVFTSSGAFNVTNVTSDFGTNVEYLVVAGGGAGGQSGPGGYGGAGGGGAGGFRTNVSGHPLAGSAFPVSVSPYTVTVGAGGARYAIEGNYDNGLNGADSVFGSITSTGGGGGGGGTSAPYGDANPGGSGGGGGYQIPAAGTAIVTSPAQGFAGGNGPGGGGSGGGGATEVGSPNPGDPGADGGDGSPIAIETSTARTYAGGGGGGGYHASNATGGSGGAGGAGNGGSGTTQATLTGGYGTASTGGGGGGAGNINSTAAAGGNGGSGIVVVRYEIGRLTAGAKATGGAISYYGGKTIHAFTNSGTFDALASISDVEYVLIGGGGGGNSSIGGGGGAGAFVYSNGSPETITLSANPYPVIIGAGGNIGSPDNQGQAGGNSIWNGYTAGGGGGGQRNSPDTNTVGRASTVPSGSAVGASGGGGSGNGNEAGAAGGAPGGYAGGNGNDPSLGSGGGGGSGGAGGNAPSNVGGLGRQLPSTFRNPVSITALGYPGPTGSVPATNPGGDTSGKYWVAGGGGGGARGNGSGQSQNGGDGGGGSGAVGGVTPVNAGYDFTGAGIGVGNNHPGKSGGSAGSNSGSGGGGAGDGRSPENARSGGQGGSGLVLIAYPS